jgi:hypothetical protein
MIGRTSIRRRLHVDEDEADAFLRFRAVGSVRQSTKIQSAKWPSVVQVFWPLMM